MHREIFHKELQGTVFRCPNQIQWYRTLLSFQECALLQHDQPGFLKPYFPTSFLRKTLAIPHRLIPPPNSLDLQILETIFPNFIPAKNAGHSSSSDSASKFIRSSAMRSVVSPSPSITAAIAAAVAAADSALKEGTTKLESTSKSPFRLW